MPKRIGVQVFRSTRRCIHCWFRRSRREPASTPTSFGRAWPTFGPHWALKTSAYSPSGTACKHRSTNGIVTTERRRLTPRPTRPSYENRLPPPRTRAFTITTDNVDPEIATIAGPQLVVPVMNARYALNAANARWGSLYDALWHRRHTRGRRRRARRRLQPGSRRAGIVWARDFLDTHCPLTGGTHADATAYVITAGALSVQQASGEAATLADPSQFVGYTGNAGAPVSVLLRHNGLHIEIQIDRNHAVGATDAAGVKDVCLESALTTIQDCEDSVAAVDAEDKVIVYRNWLGLMKGDLTDSFKKGGDTLTRRLNPDRSFTTPDGGTLALPGRGIQC